MTGDSRMLTDVSKYNGPKISFGDNSKGKTLDKNKIIHGNLTINDVLIVENLYYNLISISQLCDIGHVVEFHKQACHIRNQLENILLTGNRIGNIYKLVWKNNSPNPVCMIANNDQNWLWHKRLNHLNFKTINNICSNDLVSGIPKFKFNKNKICSACQMSKQIKSTFKNKGNF